MFGDRATKRPKYCHFICPFVVPSNIVLVATTLHGYCSMSAPLTACLVKQFQKLTKCANSFNFENNAGLCLVMWEKWRHYLHSGDLHPASAFHPELTAANLTTVLQFVEFLNFHRYFTSSQILTVLGFPTLSLKAPPIVYQLQMETSCSQQD